MMKHELEKQLDALEKKGVDRRHFFKLLAATGLIAGANTGKANAFSSSAKGKIVITRWRSRWYQYGCPIKTLA